MFGVKILPIIKGENGKTYFVDERLKQLRNVQNPHDFIDFKEGEFQVFMTIATIKKLIITDEKAIKKTLEALKKVGV
jgi:hypothetical protein